MKTRTSAFTGSKHREIDEKALSSISRSLEFEPVMKHDMCVTCFLWYCVHECQSLKNLIKMQLFDLS